MDGWLKGLIATACLVVIAGGGYFALSEWQQAADRAMIQQRQAEAIRRQEERARQQATEKAETAARQARWRETAVPDMIRNHCHQQVTSLRVAINQASSLVDFYREEVDRCVAAGHISRETVQSLLPKAAD